jgi:choline dehydrogenase
MTNQNNLDRDALSREALLAEDVERNQALLQDQLKASYDFIVCGSGSSGSVVARRLAENPNVSVLLLEAGGSDDHPEVTDPAKWVYNLGGPLDWGFMTRPDPKLNNRSLLWSMGKTLGGGSSINAMAWTCGHKNDWDYFASEAGDSAWNYESILKIYRRIEDWQGAPDPARRGKDGLVFVQPSPDPSPIVPAILHAAAASGIPIFPDHNGVMMEGNGGCSVVNLRVKDGKRLSIFRSYVYPYMDRPNLTVLTGALVTRLVLVKKRAIGVDVVRNGSTERFLASTEVILSTGAIQTPKLLMQSGIGDKAELDRFGIPCVQHLPGVGRNLQDHPLVGACIWEYATPLAPRNNLSEALFFWKSDASLEAPDLQAIHAEIPFNSAETAYFDPPEDSWSMAPALLRPASRGRLRLTGAGHDDLLDIDANLLDDPADMKALVAGVRMCREIGNSEAMKPYVKREVMPGNLGQADLEDFVRNAITTYRHQTCTAKMGQDDMSVVDSSLRVYGIKNLRIADGSIMPRITTGNTMAPCVIIGERAAQAIRNGYGL